MKESRTDNILQTGVIVILVLVSIIMVFPLYYTIVISFADPVLYTKTRGMIFFPSQVSLDAYKYILSTPVIPRSFLNSAFITAAGTCLSLFVTSTLAYALSRQRLRGRTIINKAILFTMIFSPGIIPVFLMVKSLGMLDTLWSLIIPVLSSGWYVILMKSFFGTIPASLEESALIDGADDLTIFARVVLPLSMPSLAAFGLFYAVGYWNTYLTAVFYLRNSDLWPIQVIVRNLMDMASGAASSEVAVELTGKVPHAQVQMAAVFLAMVPILMVYPFLQKHFAKGSLQGSIKE